MVGYGFVYLFAEFTKRTDVIFEKSTSPDFPRFVAKAPEDAEERAEEISASSGAWEK